MKTINLFGIALAGNNFDYKTLAQEALKCGYIVDEKCSTTEVYNFFKSININTNTTFYKTFEEVTSKDRFELFLDQVFHYMSTYGTNHEGEAYIPNDQEMPEVNFKQFKVIKSATKEEIIDKCNNMLSSGIALNKQTIKDIFEIYDSFLYVPDLEIIKNKEAKMQIYLQTGRIPSKTEEFLRYLVYLATENTLLIKNKDTIDLIKGSRIDISDKVKEFGEAKLSEIFFRFKSLFLAFKSNRKNIPIINRLRKLANKNHKPYEFGYFENILNDFSKIDILPQKLETINIFKKVSLIESIKNRLTESKFNSYIIRNGKFFIKENAKTNSDLNTLKLMEFTIYNSIIDDLREFKGKTFYIPNHLDIKVPKSEKTFIGNIPMGTEIKLPKEDLIVGINWKEKDGTRDFDLSFLDIEGRKIGWNNDFTNEEKSIIYSGDMTSAVPEATELIYFGKNTIEGLITNY